MSINNYYKLIKEIFMSDLASIFDSIINNAAQLPDTGTAANYQARVGTGNPNSKVILIDTSGSMSQTCRGGETKMEILKKAIANIDWQNYQLICFNSAVEQISHVDRIPYPSGGTALHIAIKYIQKLYPSQTLIICDGEPDDENQAIEEAKQLSGIISTLYIGDDGNKGEIEFMKKMATMGCGKIYVKDLNAINLLQLSAVINKLLLPGA
jgi:hypothetical protein